MKKTKDMSDEEEYSGEEQEEAASEEEVDDEAESSSRKKKRPQRNAAKKRARATSDDEDEEEEEEEEEDEDEEEEDEDEEEEESDSDTEKKPRRKRRKNADEEDEEDSYDEFAETGEPPKDFTSGAFVVSKADAESETDPILWRIDGKALLQKYLPFKEGENTLYKSTSTYSGWSINNKKKYLAAQVTFKTQNKNETVVELQPLDSTQNTTNEEEEN